MKMIFRWYGESDSIPLQYIKQIPNVSGVATAVYDVPAGKEWDIAVIKKLKESINNAGLEMEVIESVPVHEDIKLGLSTRDKYIEIYKKNILNLGEAGVKCICYNFMPVFDWVRTNLKTENSDGSFSLSYNQSEITNMDVKKLHLPGWDESYTPKELNEIMKKYKNISHETLFDNLVYFLREIMPTCRSAGINMAIHPDDPPWDIFGLPRIIVSEQWLDRLFEAVPDSNNGITFCTGSLGASLDNDLKRMAKKYADRIYFAHIRQLIVDKDGNFYEAGHNTNSGSLDIYGVVKALVMSGFNGYVRPDHGRSIWGEASKSGYGLYDRALGACYLNGLFEAIEKDSREVIL